VKTNEQLEAENTELRRQLQIAYKNNHKRNLVLDALHYVWCDGGCHDGVSRWNNYEPLTEEIVKIAERNTKRMRSWLINYEGRKKDKTGQIQAQSSINQSLTAKIRNWWNEYKHD